jgi:hypothetical protein
MPSGNVLSHIIHDPIHARLERSDQGDDVGLALDTVKGTRKHPAVADTGAAGDGRRMAEGVMKSTAARRHQLQSRARR